MAGVVSMSQRIPLALPRGQVRAILPHPDREEATMDFALTEQQELIRKEVAALSRNFSLDYWLEKDRKHEYPDEFVKAFAEGGWLGLMIPEAYGGAGLGVTEAAIMLHEICASGAGTSGASPIHFYCFPPEPVVRYGTEELKRRELPRIVTGERSEEHTSELQSRPHLVCRLLLEKKK